MLSPCYLHGAAIAVHGPSDVRPVLDSYKAEGGGNVLQVFKTKQVCRLPPLKLSVEPLNKGWNTLCGLSILFLSEVNYIGILGGNCIHFREVVFILEVIPLWEEFKIY